MKKQVLKIALSAFIFISWSVQAGNVLFETNFNTEDGWVSKGSASNSNPQWYNHDITYGEVQYNIKFYNCAVNVGDVDTKTCSQGSMTIYRSSTNTGLDIPALYLPVFNKSVKVSLSHENTSNRPFAIEYSSNGTDWYSGQQFEVGESGVCSTDISSNTFAPNLQIRIICKNTGGASRIFSVKMEEFESQSNILFETNFNADDGWGSSNISATAENKFRQVVSNNTFFNIKYYNCAVTPGDNYVGCTTGSMTISKTNKATGVTFDAAPALYLPTFNKPVKISLTHENSNSTPQRIFWIEYYSELIVNETNWVADLDNKVPYGTIGECTSFSCPTVFPPNTPIRITCQNTGGGSKIYSVKIEEADVTPPALLSAVHSGDAIVLTFNEPVRAGSIEVAQVNIEVASSSAQHVKASSSAQFTKDKLQYSNENNKVVTIPLDEVELLSNTTYSLQIEAGMIQDLSGNDIEEVNTTFTTLSNGATGLQNAKNIWKITVADGSLILSAKADKIELFNQLGVKVKEAYNKNIISVAGLKGVHIVKCTTTGDRVKLGKVIIE